MMPVLQSQQDFVWRFKLCRCCSFLIPIIRDTSLGPKKHRKILEVHTRSSQQGRCPCVGETRTLQMGLIWAVRLLVGFKELVPHFANLNCTASGRRLPQLRFHPLQRPNACTCYATQGLPLVTPVTNITLCDFSTCLRWALGCDKV